ncbi:hypothetical protein CRM22_007212 [Opisthorchis felineus]|uniref:SH2 domain-containing protein n=1 Tax=Opisthorchis felineus TaxID=147828 RepID=A0A4S2LGZ2_OPIFE|nr:hypothetical protein CRM22_007212 [Opisthorchis felineus]
MAPAKMLNLRGGSVSPHARPYSTSVIKVGGEVFDRDGYRMDVTVWFRHRNEVLFYLDSGGSVHGPMDQKHSTRLGNISRSGQLIPGSRYYLGDTGARNRLFRRQSEGGIWETHSESNFRGRTLSESRRPYAFERSANERSSFRHYSYSQPSAHYRTTASHHISSGLSPGPMSHISRWSSVQGAGSHGLWRGSSGSRYATTLTRQHIKRQRDPVEMVVKAPPSMGASKVDLVSIENRPMASPQPPYSPNAFSYSHYETDSNTDRIRRLQDELSSTRRELQELKRSCSLTGDQHLLSPTAGKQNVKSTSTQYLNESSWTTHTLRKNEGMPCGARITTSEVRSTGLSEKGPSHPATSVYSDQRTRNTSWDDYMLHSYNQQSNYGYPVNGLRIRSRSPSPQTSTPSQDRGLMDRVDGFNSPYLDGMRTVSTRPKEAIQRRAAFANSAPQSPITEIRSPAFESRSSSTAVVRNGLGTSGLPPVPNRFSTIRMSRNEHSPATDKLTPMGPPTEEVTMHIDPETGTPVKVTSRSQSFTDLDQNVVVTKTDEIIEKEDGTEHCSKQRTVRKTIQNSPRTRRPLNRLERHSESVRSSRVLRSKLSEEASLESPTRQSKTIGDATPYRATSQTNLAGRTTLGQQPWSSELNIRTSTSYKNTPGISTYSAHRENLMRREDQRRVIDDGTSRQYSSRCYDESKGTGTAEILEEMETITLQPIGRGVHDLEPVRSIARSYRANTPTGYRFSPIPMISRPHSSAARIPSQTPTFKSGGLSPVKPNSNVSVSTFPKHPGTISVSETVYPLPVTPPTQVHRTFAQANTVLQQQQHREHQGQEYESHQSQMGYINRPSSPCPIPGRSRIFDDTSTSAHGPMPFLPDSSQTARPASSSKGASRAYTPGPDTSDGYRTIATTNVQREIHSPGTHSPFIANDSRGTRYNSLYEARASENHFVSNAFPEQQWRAHTVPPNYAASTSGASGIGDSTDWEQGLMKLVRETYREWYMPDKKREDIHFLLRDREPGAFIIRNSVSCVNSFSLGVKSTPPGPLVSANPEYMKSGPVKHFMIQTIPMPDGRTEGVQLRGFEDQPIFPGLVQFVHHHCLHPGPLPCQLRLPVTSPNNHTRMGTGYFGSLTKYGQSNSTTAGGSGTTLHMLYLGSVNVDRLENEAAVRRAITHILTQSAINVNKLTKRCEAVVVVNPQDGIRIHDRARRGLLEKHIKPNQIVFCGLDPESRLYTDPELRTRGMIHARTVGLVVRKKQFWMHGNLVYVLTEIDPTQPALNLVQHVNQVLLS